VIDELSPQPGDFIADKHGYSAFVATGLRRWLIAGGVKTVILTGTVTYGCVLATAYSAFDLGFDVLVAADAVSAWSIQIGRMALDIVELLIGRVVSTDDLVSTMASDQLPIGVWDS
jgi:nicotinamidase-related amidase